MTNTKKDVHFAVNKIKKLGGKKIKFIIIYGSTAKGNQTSLSDIDLAVYYEGTKEERFRFRMKILGIISDKFDIQTFQDLPLYVQREVLKGKILYYDDIRFLYEKIRKTSIDFDEFKYKFYDYIRGGVIA